MRMHTSTLAEPWEAALPGSRIIPPALALVSGLLLGIASSGMISWLGWICLVPLLRALEPREKFLIPILLASMAYALVIESWSFAPALSYTGNLGLALLSYGVCAIAMALKTSLVLLTYIPVRRFSPAVKIVLWPLAATIVETLLYTLLEGYPGIQYTVGFTQAGNLVLCQLVELGDVYLLSFVVFMLNLLFYTCLRQHSLKLLLVPLCLLVALYGYGAVRIHQIQQQHGRTFKIAIVNDNSPAGLRWSRERVNEYANRILGLAATIKDRGQVVNIWNEGVLPWSYQPDDDLLCAILHSTPTSSDTLHLIGMCSNDAGHYYNSAYVLRSDGTVMGRYDKQNLLKGLEVPVLGSKLPFIYRASPYEAPTREHRRIVRAGPVRMGVVICNEGMTSKVAASFADTPYDVLVVVANDNWFVGTALIAHHFYLNRLRAIQYRKELVVNTNLGISGYVSATGAIVHQRRDSAPFVEYYEIHTHGEKL